MGLFKNVGIGSEALIDNWINEMLPVGFSTNYVKKKVVDGDIYLDWDGLYTTKGMIHDVPDFIKFYNEEIELNESYWFGETLNWYIAQNQLARTQHSSSYYLISNANLKREQILDLIPDFFNLFPLVKTIKLRGQLGYCNIQIL